MQRKRRRQKTSQNSLPCAPNLGHEKLDTSLLHYGRLDTSRQNKRMRGLVQTDLTVREVQELLNRYRRLPPNKRASVLDILTPE
jgi:hypothetical protein